WVDTQREQLKRLGINGDWDNPYLTMDFQAEATIVAELLKFAESGQLYRGAKPVMWSPVEKTALAEAEVEYEDITSTQIDVAFEIVESPISELVGAHAVIWTTTPWTIPVNQALAYGARVRYALVEIDMSTAEQAGYTLGKKGPPRFLVAKDLAESFFERFRAEFSKAKHAEELASLLEFKIVSDFRGEKLEGTITRHPMHHLGGFFAEPRPLLPGTFVTTDSGTGLVHMAPDHGEDDFDLCKAHGINPKFVVDGGGTYKDDWLWLGGDDERRRSVINPNFNAPDGPICSDLREVGALLSASADYQHSYPHSWRSKKKVIFRCTPQWFVPMDKDMGGTTLRNCALKAIADTRFVPEKGRNRIGSMVEGRPDWVLSRQRAWGVPITLFVHRESGEYLVDPDVNARIIAAVREQGVDAWDEESARDLLGPNYKLEDYERITDILDVWFDSGCTHVFTLESGRWPGMQWPADLYLEGSDQHRGWFQSSLLESCGTRGRAPYNAVLTHGFTMDSKGMKMSKSLGNTVSPLKVMEEYGADIIRLWALSVDFTEDHRIGDEILKGVADSYRKLRNTFRYMLGALDGFVGDLSDTTEIPELELYVLSLLADLDAKLRKAVDDFDFNAYTRLLIDFCNEDLSAFFFDIRKDRLYCDGPDDPQRNAYRTVLDILFHALVRYAAPVLVFTAEEVWQSRYPEDGEQGGSVHLLEWPSIPQVRADNARWDALRELREKVTEAIEPLRREKLIRSGLEANVTLPASMVPDGFSDEDLAELFITASVTRGQGDAVTVTRTTDHKCGRCWRLLPDVPDDGALCGRCADVLGEGEAA
ncbi:MAG: isoleucine--tRNA ligase, partial [Sphingomonadaceae bacterium]|nr:isoleucine--tRNA ligase [Sphingomonadaceae bacterium]